jgi:pimeloyl-ACP methyl ester carboxylesterase
MTVSVHHLLDGPADALGRITTPTLLVTRADDPATPPEHAERIAAALPHARVEVVADAAHLGVEQPEAVTKLILDHLEAA